jgi:hypothetical protein
VDSPATCLNTWKAEHPIKKITPTNTREDYEKATRYKEAIYLRDLPTKNENTIEMKTFLD